MNEAVIIPVDQFKKGELQVVCLSPVEVTVVLKDKSQETFRTEAKTSHYSLKHSLEEIEQVEVKTIEGLQYEFLPAIKAL
ncbi:hypothetical protein D3H64_09545 [Atopobacter sp. AH10]|uniref:hypothetical protein n=1 Tax=Atopobacter sp. AH10 TaxID=2315861 RepID=UPI000EF17E59|nr:hypothetical protein [Atopobacter sp. AH10]RLK62499.1 hypothetical protein D3H64_09545 [Atopobacter sp. AH10]